MDFVSNVILSLSTLVLFLIVPYCWLPEVTGMLIDREEVNTEKLYKKHERIGVIMAIELSAILVYLISLAFFTICHYSLDPSGGIPKVVYVYGTTSFVIILIPCFLMCREIYGVIGKIRLGFDALYEKSILYIERVYYEGNKIKRLEAFQRCTVFPVDILEDYLKRKASLCSKEERKKRAKKWIKKEIVRLIEEEGRHLDYSHNTELYQ